jgi:hypothetical protein
MRYLSMIRLDEKRRQAPNEQLMQDMGKLIEEMTRKGQLISTAGLRPTAEGVRVRLRGGKLSSTDGPFAETKEVIGGFFMIDAKDMKEAVAIAKRCPHLKVGFVEVRQVIPMGGGGDEDDD